MTTRHGMPIWYELQSADPEASTRFYDRVFGWSIAEPAVEVDYRMLETGDGLVGGVLRLTEEMLAGGVRPGWLFYIGVEDVDATATAITTAGGHILMGPWDVPDVGRMALVTDPQGIMFYVMRGASDAESHAFDRAAMGKCSWHELLTPDQAAGNAFYQSVLGWTYPGKMTLPGDMGDYIFVDVGDTQIGATMQSAWDGQHGAPAPGWRFYFRARDIDAAAAAVRDNGGTVLMGPHDVPTGDRIIVATDPHGVVFCVVAPGNVA